MVETSKLAKARSLLKSELERLRKFAAEAHSPAADIADQDSQIPYLRLGAEDAQGAAELLGDLGGVYQKLGKQAEALAVIEEAAEIMRATFGAKDPRYGMAADRLADAHVQNGAPQTALPIYKDVLDKMKTGLGRSHPGYQLTLDKMANAAASAGNSKVAAKAYAELIELMGAQSAGASGGGDASGGGGAAAGGGSEGGGDNSMLDELPGAVARARVRYARHLAGAKRLKDALKEAEKARDEYDSHPTLKGSLEHAMSLNGVAGILERLGRYDAAVEAMGEAYRLAQSASDADEKQVEQARKNLEGLKKHIARKKAKEEREL